MKIISEFKEFIRKGNVLDLAVGVVIGAAFGKIVTSLVNDIIMPPIGLLLNGVNFTEIKFVLKKAVTDSDGKLQPPVTINIGNFIQVFIEFLIVAFVIFLFVRIINRFRRANEEKVALTKDQELLIEIRDLLKK